MLFFPASRSNEVGGSGQGTTGVAGNVNFLWPLIRRLPKESMEANLKCKKCGSENTKNFKLLYEEGVSNGRFGGVASDGSSFAGATESATRLAQRIQPPEKWEHKPFLTSMATFAFLVIAFASFKNKSVYLIWAGIAFVVSLSLEFFISNIIQKVNKNTYEPAYKRWTEMYMCLRCGHEHHIEPPVNN